MTTAAIASPTNLFRPLTVVVQAGSALAAGMGVGRFGYTPILPLMHAQAGLSATAGAAVATANYLGYLLGALAAVARPEVQASRRAHRLALVVLVGTVALMPVVHGAAAWALLRVVAGAASALVFVIAVNTAIARLRGQADHFVGWVFGGVGGGIALSGAAVLALPGASDWRTAWLVSALLAAVLAAVAWPLVPTCDVPAAGGPVDGGHPGSFAALLTSYTLEGVGYIIAATFLVAAVDAGAPSWLGASTWIVVGVAAIPASAAWALLARWRGRPVLLRTALGLQAIGIALPALVSGPVSAMTSAALFGATFLGVGTLTLGLGAALRVPRAVPLLTAGYGVGQIAGPLVAAPLLHDGYPRALLLAAAIVGLAALAAARLRLGVRVRCGISR